MLSQYDNGGSILRPLLIALQFLTRIPTPQLDKIENKDLGASLLYYPFVGFLIGVFLLLIAFCFSSVPSLVLAAISVVAWLAITGALHVDGLADTADAWIGGYGDKERTLSLMKDPTCGPMAVSAIVSILLVKTLALSELINAVFVVESMSMITLLIAPFIARTAVIVLFLTTDYVREGGLGDIIKRDLPRLPAQCVCGLALMLVLLMLGGKGLALILTVLLVFILLRMAFIQRLGGTTGDTAGALVEIIEVVTLVVLVSL